MSISPTSVPVVPGEQSTATVRIRNTGVVVDQFAVTVLGQPAVWTTAVPAVLSLFPGAEGTIELHFAPPRTAEVGAGSVPFGVRVDPSQDPEGSVVEEGEVNLLPFVDVQAKLTPRTSEAKKKARHEVLVDNRGNSPVEAEIDATDPDELLAFDVKQQTVTVPAGQTIQVPVKVAARKGFLKGTEKHRPFQVRITVGQGHPPITLDGTLMQKAGMPRFVMPLVGAAVVLALVALVLPAMKKDTTSGKLSLTSEQAATTTTIVAAPEAPAAQEPVDPNAPATPEETAAAAAAELAANGKDTTSPATAGAGDDTSTGDSTTAAGTGDSATVVPQIRSDDTTSGGDESSDVTSPTATTAAPPPPAESTGSTTSTTVAPTTTAPPAHAKYLGTWKNVNPSTKFQPQTDIRADASSIYVRGYGACSPSYCNWGEGKTTLADGSDNEIRVVIATSTGNVKQVITYSAGQLKIHSDKYRTDGTYWYSFDETFNKA